MSLLDYADLPDEVKNYGLRTNPQLPKDAWLSRSYKEIVAKSNEIMKEQIEDTLHKNEGNVSGTARELGMARHQLAGEMRRLHIEA